MGVTMRLSPAHRGILVFALIAVLALPAIAYASSYYSTLSFSYQLKGATRSYTGTNMNICMTAKAPVTSITTFTVKLYRDRTWPIPDDYIGYSTFPRNGSKTATWTNVGSANYYFFFSKANDGVTVTSNNVHMYN